MAKEKKQFRQLSEEELEQVNGGNNVELSQEYLDKLSSIRCDANYECIKNESIQVSSIPKKDLL